jgi:hypothetical protein
MMFSVMTIDFHLMVHRMTAMLALGATTVLLAGSGFSFISDLRRVNATFRLAMDIHLSFIDATSFAVLTPVMMTFVTFHFNVSLD